jgi:Arc/MetJ family transcription regulator
MRTTVVIDDEQLAAAREFTGIREMPALVREAFNSLLEREASRRLAMLGGTQKKLRPIPRRRSTA